MIEPVRSEGYLEEILDVKYTSHLIVLGSKVAHINGYRTMSLGYTRGEKDLVSGILYI